MRATRTATTRAGRTAAVLCVLLGCRKHAPPPPPPPEVQVVTVVPQDLPIFAEWIATLDGSVNAQIRAQVTGYLLSQNYAEGTVVKTGDLLFQIDPRPFESALAQAEAKLAQDRAQLAKNRNDVQRYTPLAREQAISREELDNAIHAERGAAAQVKADEAAVESARVNLGFTQIRSPIDGLAGTAVAQIGDLVSQSGGALTTVSRIDPIRANFQITEQLYLQFQRENTLAAGHPAVALQLTLADGSRYPQAGRVLFTDRQVNPTTGTVQIVGIFPNPSLILRPGQYGRVHAQTHVERQALAVPQRALSELQGSYQLALVDAHNRIHIQPVTTGDRVGSLWVVRSGLHAGDRVVVEGVQKAKEGQLVNPRPYTAPPVDAGAALDAGPLQAADANQPPAAN